MTTARAPRTAGLTARWRSRIVGAVEVMSEREIAAEWGGPADG